MDFIYGLESSCIVGIGFDELEKFEGVEEEKMEVDFDG